LSGERQDKVDVLNGREVRLPIVTGYEDTPAGHDALVLGAQLARLTALRPVVTTVYPGDGRGVTAVARDPRWRQRTEVVARDRLARARTLVGGERLGADPEFCWLGPASPHTALVEYADEVGASVLVVGSTGHGLAGRLAPGGTVQRLLPLARCPVAVAPRGYRHVAREQITVIAVAYDASPEADRAAAVAAHLAACTGAALRFVAVAEAAVQRPAARAAVQRGLAYAPAEIDAFVDVVDGTVGRTLADLPGRTDLLVIGLRGYRFLRRLLLGGAVGVLVREAYYPVVVVPA
jgi:nucleotide-binding universal stress UspA family protein